MISIKSARHTSKLFVKLKEPLGIINKTTPSVRLKNRKYAIKLNDDVFRNAGADTQFESIC